MANSDTISNKSSNRPKTPCTDGQKRVGFARPTLIIPPPQMQRMHSGHSAGVIYTGGPGGPTPDMYGRKASMFVFDQFNGIRDFTMSTAKSGLGIGEKCSYWLYNKFRLWSRKWFTHWFLTIVLVLYTIGGAVGFIYIEGHNEQRVREHDIRRDRYILIRELRNLSLEMPKKTSDGEWEGEAVRRLIEFEKNVIETYQKHALLMTNPQGKIWTMWNAVVYCATIYTTIVWSEETLRALKAVKYDGQSINSTSKKLGRFTSVFSPEQEAELFTYPEKKFGLASSYFLKLLFDYETRNNISYLFKNGKAGDDWLLGFKRRHLEIVLRAPEPTSLARTRGLNQPELFYTNYWNLVENTISMQQQYVI